MDRLSRIILVTTRKFLDQLDEPDLELKVNAGAMLDTMRKNFDKGYKMINGESPDAIRQLIIDLHAAWDVWKDQQQSICEQRNTTVRNSPFNV